MERVTFSYLSNY